MNNPPRTESEPPRCCRGMVYAFALYAVLFIVGAAAYFWWSMIL